jgi:hypothetical protein
MKKEMRLKRLERELAEEINLDNELHNLRKEREEMKREKKNRKSIRMLKKGFVVSLLASSILFVGCGTDEPMQHIDKDYYYCTEEIETDLAGNEYRYIDNCYIGFDLETNKLILRTFIEYDSNIRCLIDTATFNYDGLILYNLESSCERFESGYERDNK